MNVTHKHSEIKKLSISVTEACNLNCAYCYVRNGSAEVSSRMMSPELARVAVRRIMQEYGSTCNTVQFFGGEPNLNLHAMEAAVDETKRLWESSTLPGEPRFAIVTNLTLLSDEIISFYKQNDIVPAVSLDGPQKIHDLLRPYCSGKGSHQTIVENIQRLNGAGISFSIGATYTYLHLKKGITVIDLLKYFEDLNAARADVITVIANCSPALDLYRDSQMFSLYLASLKDSIAYWFECWPRNGELIFESAARILQLLSDTSEKQHFCPAGRSYIAVDCKGGVYPCHMFIGDEAYRLGEVKTAEPIAHFQIPLCKDTSCKDCWAASLCVTCLGRIKNYRGNLSQLFHPDCFLKRVVIQEVLNNVDNLRYQNPSSHAPHAALRTIVSC